LNEGHCRYGTDPAEEITLLIDGVGELGVRLHAEKSNRIKLTLMTSILRTMVPALKIPVTFSRENDY
tara:strand:+ start:114 stop:314 length:201 start_codon:yes stop_codon:yes gene_type:complete